MCNKTPSQILSPEQADLAQQQEEGQARALANPDLGLVTVWVKVWVRVMVVLGRAKVLVQVMVLVSLGWVKELHYSRHWFPQAPVGKLYWPGHPLRKTKRQGWVLGKGRCWLRLLCNLQLPR